MVHQKDMKICLILQRRFVYIGHLLATHLKERYGLSDFCAYVYRRQGYNYLVSQKDIFYSAIVLDEDAHELFKQERLDLKYIQYLEKEYGIPNLWPYIEVDRIIRFHQLVREYPYNSSPYSHEDMMKMVQARARKIIEMLHKERPDCIVTSVIGGLGSLLLYHIAKKMGIPTHFISVARVGTRYVLSEDYARFTSVEKIFDDYKNSGKDSKMFYEAKHMIEEFRGKPKTYDKTLQFYLNRTHWFRQMDFLLPAKIKRYSIWLWRVLINYFFAHDKKDYSYVNPFGKIKDQIQRKFRNFLSAFYSYDTVDFSEDYGYFPLHLEPEITTLLYAPFYTDQLHLAKQIARSLPFHYKLYVKEQPAMAEYRPRKFYKELKKVPNIKLIDPKVSSFDLIKHSKIITTITGTSGWEGLFFGKPAVTFGEVFYNKLSMVKRCDSIEKLPYIIQDQLENFHYNEKDFINFLGVILEESIDVDLARLWEREPDMEKKKEGLRPLADFLAKKLLKKDL